MSRIYQSVKSCIFKTPVSEQVELITDTDDGADKPDAVNKENAAPEYLVNKKTDEVSGPGPEGGLIWRMSSGMYSTATGAVGMGIGGAKWVASKTYDISTNVGSTVATYAKVPSMQSLKKKDKKE